MVAPSPESEPIRVGFEPQRQRRSLPVEVIDRSAILERLEGSGMVGRSERVGFHVLIVCTGGRGRHVIDFEEYEVSPGTCLRIHPGQVQRYIAEPVFEAAMVVWRDDVHPADPESPPWYPGSDAAAAWHLDGDDFETVLRSLGDLREEQRRFDGSRRRTELLRSLLATLLLRLAIEVPASVPNGSRVPPAYLEFRARLEERLYERPTVLELADELGYSSRTLDRACHEVTGQTAKQVVDERTTLEIRRLLTETDRPIARIGAEFGFTDASNFSKFVKRHIGVLPGELRTD